VVNDAAKSALAETSNGETRELPVSYSGAEESAASPGRSALADTLAVALALVRADAGVIYLATGPGREPALLASVGLPESFLTASSGEERLLGAMAAETGRTVVVDDVATLRPPARDAARNGGFAAFASVPVPAPNGLLLGALDVHFREPRRLSRRERRALEAAARQLGWIAETQRWDRSADVLPPRPAPPAGAMDAGILTHLSAVLAPLPIGVLLVAPDGRVALANPEAVRVLGAPVPGAPGAGARWSGFHPDGRPVLDHEWPVSRALDENAFVPAEDVLWEGPDGERRWVRMGAAPARDADGRSAGIVVTLLDVDASRRLSERERKGVRHAERMQTLTAALSGAATPAGIAEVVVSVGVHAVDAVAGAMFERVADRPQLDLVDATGYPATTVERWRHVAIDDATPIAAAMRDERPVWVRGRADWERDWPEVPEEERWPFGAALAVLPVALRGEPAGALVFSFDEPRAFDRAECEYLELLARHVAEALDRARLYRDAEAASQAKSDFLSVVSHELRTPLNAILGYAGLIADEIPGPINEAQREQLERLQAGARQLLEVIEQILTLTRADATPESESRIQEVGADALLAELVEQLGARARRKGVLLDRRGSDEVGVVRTDPARLRQLLQQLLENALKFTERGGQVTVAARREGDRMVIDVRDTGIGIAPEHLERIFEPFWQVDRGRTRRATGTGLGLSVARRLSRQLGGDVTVSSSPGLGTVFTVWIPTDGS
jgi:signal transduction histidine kinase